MQVSIKHRRHNRIHRTNLLPTSRVPRHHNQLTVLITRRVAPTTSLSSTLIGVRQATQHIHREFNRTRRNRPILRHSFFRRILRRRYLINRRRQVTVGRVSLRLASTRLIRRHITQRTRHNRTFMSFTRRQTRTIIKTSARH